MSFNELCEAIVTDHGYLECHTRLNLRAQEWNRSDRAEALLLRAGHLQAVDVFLEKAAVIEVCVRTQASVGFAHALAFATSHRPLKSWRTFSWPHMSSP